MYRVSIPCATIFCSLCIMHWGCSRDSRPYEDHSRDARRYALNLKQMVYDVVKDAVTAREPADIIWPLVLELEQNNSPRGEFAEIIDQLRQHVTDLHISCEKTPNGRPADLQSRLQHLIALAEKLPGEAQMTTQPTRD